MATVQQDWYAVETEDYVPTTEDLADYHAWSSEIDARWFEERLEREDRMAEMEKIRKSDFANARSAACVVRGIAGSLRCQGLDGAAERLLAASDDVMALVTRYA